MSYQEEREREIARQQAVFDEAKRKEAALKAELIAPGGVEGYAERGRAIMFTGLAHSAREVMKFGILPPKGTQTGDHFERHIGGIYRFVSPDGKTERGLATIVTFTPAEADALQARLGVMRSASR